MTAPSTVSLVVTQGDPRGIGLELILRIAAEGGFGPTDTIVADPEALAKRAENTPAPWAKPGWAAIRGSVVGEPGLTQTAALAQGVDLVLDDPQRALVTAPIDKKACAQEGFAFPGHTEYLAHRAGGCPVAMLMAGPKIRVVLATIHMPLRSVPEALTPERIVSAGRLLAQGLRERFGVAAPRVAVLGLNPHAGERGLLGNEESDVIAPAVAQLRAELSFATFSDALPADTAFHAQLRGDYDGVVAMYHDQGLGPFKLMHFHDGVNVTLGLPFVRTSPDHGTALDIAGTGRADPSSMRAAMGLARGELW